MSKEIMEGSGMQEKVKLIGHVLVDPMGGVSWDGRRALLGLIENHAKEATTKGRSAAYPVAAIIGPDDETVVEVRVSFVGVS